MMARIAVWIGVLCLSCATSQMAGDPHAVGPRHDRWEAVIAQPRPAVFGVALRVLTDSGYVMAQENRDVAAISTADRRSSSAQPGGQQQPGTMPGSDYPIRLSLVLTPLGPDSTRLTITGQYRLENIGATVNARSDEWRFVRGIGEAILAQLKR